MWSRWMACAILLAGSVCGFYEPLAINVDIGDEFELYIDKPDLEKCYLIGPNERIIEGEDLAGRFTVKVPTAEYGCLISVSKVDHGDIGDWEIHAETKAGLEVFEIFTISIKRNSLDIAFQDADITWLPLINFTAQAGIEVSMTLSKLDYDEECYLRASDDTFSTVRELNREGIRVFESSQFVSCRVVLGPMDIGLAGTWDLCGSHSVNGKTLVRCQPGLVNWNNTGWAPVIQTHFNHYVHFGMSISPVVRGTGTVLTCHIITPNGEDIAVPENSNYPGITRVVVRDLTFCNITLGPIHEDMIGDWTIYGRYTGSRGMNEIWQPMSLRIYDEENPYNQAYNVSTLETHKFLGNIGGTVQANVTGSGTVENCYFMTPKGEVYDRLNATMPGVAFIVADRVVECRISIGPLSNEFFGEWQLIGKFINNMRFNETRLPFHIIQEGIIDRTPGVTWLPQIEYGTLNGEEVSITLSRTAYDEECSLRTPQDESILLDELDLEGIRAYGNSQFVSCGVVIGPMDASRLGIWALCGSRKENNNEFVRCQLTRIFWNNNSTNATYVTQRDFNHVVHFGMSIAPAVRGTGNVQTCHIVTPNGEDLIVTTSSNYPGITRVNTGVTFCNISLSIREGMLGDWTVYGRFIGNRGFNQISQPVHLFLYDEDNPYSQAYNVSILEPAKNIVSVGSTIQLNVTGAGGVDSCYFRTPKGELFTRQNATSEVGATFVDAANNRVIECRISIGPIADEHIGEWELIGKFSNNRGFNETRLPFHIIREGFIDRTPGVTWLPQIEYSTLSGGNISITLSRTIHDEECFLRTPEDKSIPLDELNRDDIMGYGSSAFVSCGVVLGPMNAKLLGIWALCGSHYVGDDEHVRCQLARIGWNNNSTNATWATQHDFDHVVNFGMYLSPVVRGTGTIQSCHVVTPNGEDITLTESSTYPGINRISVRETAFCSVTLGPINAAMLGDWTVYGRFVGNRGFNEIHQPVHLFLYDEDNPYNQAYNVTMLAPVNRVVNLASSIEILLNGTGSTDNCYFQTPSGLFYTMQNVSMQDKVTFTNANNRPECRISVGPITADMIGAWRLIGKFRNNARFDESRLPFNITLEDPSNPEDSVKNRIIETLNSQRFETVVGGHHTLSAAVVNRRVHESCHIRTPDGLQYKMMPGFNIPGLQQVTGSNIACGISVTVETKDLIGEWMLITREHLSNVHYERRLPFTIYVEETVDAFPPKVTIAKNNDLYIRLQHRTKNYQTCKLLRPSNNEAEMYKYDEEYLEYCGFIVQNMQLSDSGRWAIQYENRIVYRAETEVNVTARWSKEDMHLIWTKDRQVDQFLGPADAMYCRVVNPSGHTVFEGFGMCSVNLERVTQAHNGTWKMIVGAPGHVVADEHAFLVTVIEAESKPMVMTNVEQNKPLIMLSCSVLTEYQVQSCKFRDPSGRLLLVNDGVGEDRYRANGMELSMESDFSGHVCKLWIRNPLTSDLGLWRCAVETVSDVYFGFLRVLCPFALAAPGVADIIVTEPELSPDKAAFSAAEGDSITLSCSVQSAIRYCYFRARNGTIFNVSPGSRSHEYAGAGFDAGECGVRFPGLLARDSGLWSCHVGLLDHLELEQHAQFNVIVEESMVAVQILSEDHSSLVIASEVHNSRPLDYCRFVRKDGLGFTEDNIPVARYSSYSLLSEGHCKLHIWKPTILDMHPWTVVALITGQEEEVFRVTGSSFPDTDPDGGDDETYEDDDTDEVKDDTEEVKDDTDEVKDDTEEDYDDYEVVPPMIAQNPYVTMLWILVVLQGLSLVAMAIMLGPRKNRRWTFARASSIRSSLRNSFRKETPSTLAPETLDSGDIRKKTATL